MTYIDKTIKTLLPLNWIRHRHGSVALFSIALFITSMAGFCKTARAQGLTEYGLILTFVAFVAIVGLTMFGNALGDQIGSLLSSLGTSV